MLYADKAALENRTKVKLLSIRERELALYTNNCRTVGTVSALMAGIAYSALIYTKMAYFQESSTLQQFLYITGLVVCMCLSLRNVLGTTMLTMLGPGKALRGPDGSMHSAVDGMLDAFDGISYVQHLTIYSFMMTSIVYGWGAASMSFVSSILLTVLIGGMTYIMWVQSGIVERAFPMRSIPLVSGAFFPKGDAATRAMRGAAQSVGAFWGSRTTAVESASADARDETVQTNDDVIRQAVRQADSRWDRSPPPPELSQAERLERERQRFLAMGAEGAGSSSASLPAAVALPPPPPLAGGLDRIAKQQRLAAAQQQQQQQQQQRRQQQPSPPRPSTAGYQSVASGAPNELM